MHAAFQLCSDVNLYISCSEANPLSHASSSADEAPNLHAESGGEACLDTHLSLHDTQGCISIIVFCLLYRLGYSTLLYSVYCTMCVLLVYRIPYCLIYCTLSQVGGRCGRGAPPGPLAQASRH